MERGVRVPWDGLVREKSGTFVLSPGLTALIGLIIVLLFVACLLLVYLSPQLVGGK
jgi:hypothetical protein